MRILITGLRGFVGQHLARRLKARCPGIEILPVIPDITDVTAVESIVSAGRPDHCIHLAAISTIGAARHNPDHAWTVNLHGTLNVARAMLRHAPDGIFLFASTAETYGLTFQQGHPLDERAALAPANPYAATKAAADLALGAMAQEGLRAVRMRPFNHTGPGQSPNFVAPAFASQIARIAKGFQPPEIRVGNLDAKRDFLDVRDVCDAYVDALIADRMVPPGSILNLCSGQSRSIRSILDDLLALSGISASITTDPERLRPSDIPVAAGNAAHAREMLGWVPKIPWEQTLKDIYEDCLNRVTPVSP
ncbi:GDP-mannose 4,6-dehydratase [Gluconobacter morbifer]|uniref:GDP-6-deoxy-D-lyxo-4-hexulose reductase n=1 Tax=Gluconobacter morbifer G707 TaxID=1088869 RepID=G6XFD8_9PROT|nr:GDP-mannose 4,6-dehydratase [Gluconobacter morbifer]EHH68896.1 GDP-6-deoxy-D-lyxo-4-hexulose reductase [Gluconobacter morbifer G707]